MNPSQIKNTFKSFTLVELLMVILVIGILATTAWVLNYSEYQKTLWSRRCSGYIAGEINSFINAAVTHKWFYADGENSLTFPDAYQIRFEKSNWNNTDTSIELRLEASDGSVKLYKIIDLAPSNTTDNGFDSWCVSDSYFTRLKSEVWDKPTSTAWIRITKWLETDRSDPLDKNIILDEYTLAWWISSPWWDHDFTTPDDLTVQKWYIIIESCTDPTATTPICREKVKVSFDARTARTSSHECDKYSPAVGRYTACAQRKE